MSKVLTRHRIAGSILMRIRGVRVRVCHRRVMLKHVVHIFSSTRWIVCIRTRTSSRCVISCSLSVVYVEHGLSSNMPVTGDIWSTFALRVTSARTYLPHTHCLFGNLNNTSADISIFGQDCGRFHTLTAHSLASASSYVDAELKHCRSIHTWWFVPTLSMPVPGDHGRFLLRSTAPLAAIAHVETHAPQNTLSCSTLR
jgi:hypothetical protein